MSIPNQNHLSNTLKRVRPKQVFKKTRIRLERIAERGGKCSTCSMTNIVALMVVPIKHDFYVVCRNCYIIEKHLKQS